eukprot:8213982-Pyramimonas_sp.AAC.1
MFALQLRKRQDPVPDRCDKVLILKESFLPHRRHIGRVCNQCAPHYLGGVVPRLHSVRPCRLNLPPLP